MPSSFAVCSRLPAVRRSVSRIARFSSCSKRCACKRSWRSIARIRTRDVVRFISNVDVCGNVPHVDCECTRGGVTCCDDCGGLHRIEKLPHVAGPVERGEPKHRGVRDISAWACAGQQRTSRPHAARYEGISSRRSRKGGKMNMRTLDAEVQVFAERACPSQPAPGSCS